MNEWLIWQLPTEFNISAELPLVPGRIFLSLDCSLCHFSMDSPCINSTLVTFFSNSHSLLTTKTMTKSSTCIFLLLITTFHIYLSGGHTHFSMFQLIYLLCGNSITSLQWYFLPYVFSCKYYKLKSSWISQLKSSDFQWIFSSTQVLRRRDHAITMLRGIQTGDQTETPPAHKVVSGFSRKRLIYTISQAVMHHLPPPLPTVYTERAMVKITRKE